MIYKRWKLCITATMLLLCGCSQGEDSALTSANGSQQTEQQREIEVADGIEDGREKTEKVEETKNTFSTITVIDTLPEVDETIPREQTKLPSSEVIMIVGDKEKKLHIKQEDGIFSDEQFNVYNVVCHDHDVSFAMPEDGQITWECSREESLWYDYLIWEGEGSEYQYRVAVPILNEDAGSWLIQAEIKKGADNPEDCWNALSVFMQTFHANPYFYYVKEGDTLYEICYEIAKTYLDKGESYLQLANINGLADPDFIYEGQLIEIPVEK